MRDNKSRIFINLGADWEALKTWLYRFDYEYFQYLENLDIYRDHLEKQKDKQKR